MAGANLGNGIPATHCGGTHPEFPGQALAGETRCPLEAVPAGGGSPWGPLRLGGVGERRTAGAVPFPDSPVAFVVASAVGLVIDAGYQAVARPEEERGAEVIMRGLRFLEHFRRYDGSNVGIRALVQH